MRDGVRLVNAARGALLDEEALLAALASGKVAGAALDVFSKEPYDGPLLELPNVVVTPHLAASTGEAQDRAGVIVAEQVAAALEGGLVTNAVNIPVIGAEDAEVLGPYVPLAAKLGRIAMELTGGHADEISVTAYGGLADYDTRLLTVAALMGAFQGRSRPAGELRERAAHRRASAGSRCARSAPSSARDYTNLLRVEIRTGGEEVRVSGTTIGREHRQWLVHALGFDLELELAPLLVVFRYDDVPGRDREGRHALRRGRREHREHDRVAHAAGRQGADGAHRRQRAAARARRPGSAARASSTSACSSSDS